MCKIVIDPSVSATSDDKPSPSKNQSKQVDDMITGKSFEYYQKLFLFVFTIAEEELAFLKLKPQMVMQMRNDLILGS